MKEITEDIRTEYEKIKDKISYDDFLKELESRMKDYEEVSFMGELDVARVIVGEHIDEENQPLSENNPLIKIAELKTGNQNINLIGRVMGISNIKKFTNKKGKVGKLANLILADETGQIRIVMWTENIKLLKNFSEGDAIKISNVDIKQGFRSDNNEAHLKLNSTIHKLSDNEFSELPSYKEKIANIKDIKADMEVNVIARIVRIPRTRTFERNGNEGKVTSIELQDQTGKITYTLWNKDVDLVDDLDLNEGDSVKILGAESRSRNDEISLVHRYLSKIIKDKFNVPEYHENILKIGDAHEIRDVTIIGVVSKLYDTITFTRSDESTGRVRSMELEDDTGRIKVTFWNDDTRLELKKGDIIKITGGNIEFDEYSGTNYRVNTNWNTKIIINPPLEDQVKKMLLECGKYLKPYKIGELSTIEDEGEEVDIIGRLVNISEPNQFHRDDGSVGLVRSAEIADDSGAIRVSFWDEKAESNLNMGDAVKIENARTRMGIYNVELSVGKTARLIKPNVEEIENLPSINEIEDKLYESKSIDELKEGDKDLRVFGRIIELTDPNNFARSDGTPGLVRSAEIGDQTGIVKLSLWDEQAKKPLNEGNIVKIENPRVSYRNGNIELSVGRNTTINIVKNEEAEGIPSINEIQNKLYVTKKIDEIEENDQNVKVKGKIIDARGNKILYQMCPNCNKSVTLTENGFVCDMCGEDIENPNLLLIVSLDVEDDTGTMNTTFFRKAAEKLIGKTTHEVNEIIKNTGDEGSLEDLVNDLIESDITIIADARFDDYNEEIRLTAKKILEMKI